MHFDPLSTRRRRSCAWDPGREHQHLLRTGGRGRQRRGPVGPSRRPDGIYIGCTEHGNVETENEIYAISKFKYDTRFWSHYHNPRTVANNPAGEVSLHMGINRAGLHDRGGLRRRNLGLIHAAQMLPWARSTSRYAAA